MKHLAVIGRPLGQTLSPHLHGRVYSLLGIAADYTALDTGPGNLSEVADKLRRGELAGINITIPYKNRFLDYLDSSDPQVQLTGAVNCVSVADDKLIGHNTDVAGIIFALEQHSVRVEKQSAIILGTGGAARAAVIALHQAGAGKITVAGRREEAVSEICHHFQSAAGVQVTGQQLSSGQDVSSHNIIINTTPVGMWPNTDQAILAANQLRPGQAVFDAVYHPATTRLLAYAQERGCQVVNGLAMFIGQALASIDHWFDGITGFTGGVLHPALNLDNLTAELAAEIGQKDSRAQGVAV
ncbi:MAG: shikimate dehydrogenase [Candidatus Marinimicrobia bacterium]|nr:shikimate dehydrogenase [Candidatus Neomarinimicrobiota bacterium]